MLSRETLGFIAFFVRKYPARTVLLVALLFLAGLAEGIGIAALLPALEITISDESQVPSGISRVVLGALESVGIAPSLEIMLALVVAAIGLKGAFRLLAMKQVGYMVSRVSTDLRILVIRTLLRTQWSYFISQPSGRFANAIGMEANRASNAYRSVCTMLAALIQVAMYTAIAVVISWQIATLALVAGLLTALMLGRLVATSRNAARQQTKLMKSLTARLIDALNGIKPVKAMGREKHFQQLLEAETRGINRSQERQVLASESLKAAQEPIVMLLMSIVLYYSIAIQESQVTSVLILAFLFYRLAGRLGEVQLNYQAVTIGESAFWSIHESIESARAIQEPRRGRLAPPQLKDSIRLVGVEFDYGGRPVLEHVDLEVPAGQMVALVGASGSGKTTIADLITGLYQPRAGQILIDDVPLDRIDMSAWRSQIGYVPQEMFLFHDTLYNNLTVGDESVPESDVRDALAAAGALDFVDRLPHGLQSVMGERGARLSGGQRQRIAIARALVRKPRLLILDEVTTSLDPATEASICDTLRGLRGNVTILAVSHQPAVMVAADIVYTIGGGNATRMMPREQVHSP
jgi:ATP-binding cassette, subfamily C, bacterial